MVVLCVLSLFLLFSLPEEISAAPGDLNDVCNSGACGDTTAVCDTSASKCLYKAAAICTTNTAFCVTGAACGSQTSPCLCDATHVAKSNGLCGLIVDQGCTATGVPCLDNGDCTNLFCKCKTGYTQSADKKTCTAGAMGLVSSLLLVLAALLTSTLQ